MKKLLVLLGLLAFLAACGGEQAAKPTADAGATKVAAADNGDIAKTLVGEWECEETGDVLPTYKMGKPSGFTFGADGSYVYFMTINGVTVTWSGKYTINTSVKPNQIDFVQEKIKDKSGNFVTEINGKKAADASWGIFELKDGKFYTKFYRKAFFPRPEEIEGTDAQIFKKK